MYILVDEMGSDSCSFLFRDYPFFEPLDRFPAFEFYEYFVGVNVLVEIEKNAAIDSVSCDVERLVNLYEDVRHN